MPSIAAVHILTPQQRCCRAQPRCRDVVPENGVSMKGTAWQKGDASGIRENTDARYLGVAIFRSLAICILVGTG